MTMTLLYFHWVYITLSIGSICVELPKVSVVLYTIMDRIAGLIADIFMKNFASVNTV
jgi:hypothetical protein